MITAAPENSVLDDLLGDLAPRLSSVMRANAADLLLDVLPLMQPRHREPLLDFAERVIHYPSGPKKGLRFDRRDQPAQSAFLSLLDSDRWRRAHLIAVNQGGKTLALLIWTISNLINVPSEDTGFALPTLDNHWKKAFDDMRVIFDASDDLRPFWPTTGPASQGGSPPLVRLNGSRLIALGMGAGQEQRSSHTCRKLGITEAKASGAISAGDEKQSVYEQLEKRTASYQGRQLLFSESTLTTEENISWTMWLEGTGTLPHFPCDGCGEHVCPDMEDLQGWENCKTELEVRENTRFHCPECGRGFDPVRRLALLQDIVPLHRGQKVGKNGEIVGPDPPTTTLSYRIPASSSMFSNEGELGVHLWKLQQIENPRKRARKERGILQGYFCLPAPDDLFADDALDPMLLTDRLGPAAFGTAPEGTTDLFGGVDVRETALHGTVTAFRKDGGPVVIWWGAEPILEGGRRWKERLIESGKRLQKKFAQGFPSIGGPRMPVTFTLIDAHWKPDEVYELALLDPHWRSAMGFGDGVLRDKSYRQPKTTNSKNVRWIGDNFHIARPNENRGWVVEHDASAHKRELHEWLSIDEDDPAAVTFASGEPAELRWLIDHITAEVEVSEGEGGESKRVFRQLRDDQHLLDSTSYSLLAGKVYPVIKRLSQRSKRKRSGQRKKGFVTAW